jgi:hypothetical protein
MALAESTSSCATHLKKSGPLLQRLAMCGDVSTVDFFALSFCREVIVYRAKKNNLKKQNKKRMQKNSNFERKHQQRTKVDD